MNEISIKKGILHILDTSVGAPILSDKVMELAEPMEYLEKHITRLLGDSEIKECVFEQIDHPIKDLILNTNEDNFLSHTRQMADSLYQIMISNPDIPSADVFFCTFIKDGHRYLGIIKFNYKEAYTHRIQNADSGTEIGMLKYRTLFPSESQKVDECIMINLQDFTIQIKEKKYEIDGQRDFYLSSLFMKTQPARSYKEQVKIVEKSAEQIVKKYYSGDSLKSAEIKAAILNNTDENMEVHIDSLAKEVFSDSPDMQDQYKSELSKKGFSEDKIKINQQIYTKLERSHKIITDIGIKMDIPTELLNDTRKVEFIVNQDGTMSILIKNINEMRSR
ncbi:nucleoid-associated protein [Sinanaerobacter chloroacetimidivorans]|uniref:Nucleoid-associated protein n=1 Tax=Sinanaerobacter chloroacetimidivorans TaxID=2818044 RepID=A0A8J8B359_9FIRM|nr:nucleoid-associated protein [Sinanaerobacter chloroacetimidivorans]MBR0597970.1 nucleoid-associated protein [Sinanaerobacter chloroacetimidivorans]